MAVGWLCVSTFISTCTSSSRPVYRLGRSAASGSQRSRGPPTITDALSEYATTVPSPASSSVCRIIPNSDRDRTSPSTTKSALKILWRQCSELACANIISSTSEGLRSRPVKASTR